LNDSDKLALSYTLGESLLSCHVISTDGDGLLPDPNIESKRMANPCAAQEVQQKFAMIVKPLPQVTENIQSSNGMKIARRHLLL